MTRLPSLGRRGEGWLAAQLLLALVVLRSATVGPRWRGSPRIATSVAGLALVGGGVLLAARGVRDLGRSITPLPRPREGAELVQTGAYARVRHPIYGGLVLASAGWGLLTASPAALALAPVVAAFFWLKSAREEAWLAERFPEYEAYRRRTRRLLPGIW
ncbi:MAG: isoprenylcysteine carboxylmethyltransferase family protein [Chloroflexota bacterium]|nr:isoprenylcysteine carboxylmethyltransferase family protein [Chloroflexota bacterium]